MLMALGSSHGEPKLTLIPYSVSSRLVRLHAMADDQARVLSEPDRAAEHEAAIEWLGYCRVTIAEIEAIYGEGRL